MLLDAGVDGDQHVVDHLAPHEPLPLFLATVLAAPHVDGDPVVDAADAVELDVAPGPHFELAPLAEAAAARRAGVYVREQRPGIGPRETLVAPAAPSPLEQRPAVVGAGNGEDGPFLGGADLRLRKQLRFTGPGAVLGQDRDVLQFHHREPHAVEPHRLVHQMYVPDDAVAVHQEQSVAGVVTRPVEPAEEVLRGRVAAYLFQEFDEQPVIAEMAGYHSQVRAGTS